MTDLPKSFRAATREDAPPLTDLVDMAGEGLPMYLWANMAKPGESPGDVGLQRAQRETGGFSYRNATLREVEGEVVASLIGYALPESPEPADYDDMPAMFVPLQQLEDMVPGTWYVNVLASYPEHRGKGYGSELLAIADQLAEHSKCKGLSIIVSDANAGARRLYERSGYREMATRPMVKEGWKNDGEHWLLLRKDLVA